MEQISGTVLTTDENLDDAPDSLADQAVGFIHQEMAEHGVGPYVNILDEQTPTTISPGVEENSKVLEGEVLDAPSSAQPRRKIVYAGIAVEGLLEPKEVAGYQDATQLEAEALAASGKQIPVKRKGNRRPRRNKTNALGQPVRNLPAVDDPIIQRRRAYAMQYWNKGWGLSQVRDKVNEFLVEQGLQPVSPETIRLDKEAIYREWEADYDSSSAKNRATHIASLNRMKAEAWEAYEHYRAQDKGATAAAQFLKTCVSIEAELAVLDGSKKRAEVAAAVEAEQGMQSKITRVYIGVDMPDMVDNPTKQLEDHGS